MASSEAEGLSLNPHESVYVIVNRAGPVWDLARLAELARVLGQSYSGEIWTFADDGTQDRRVGAFRIRRDRLSLSAGILRKAARVARLIGRGIRLRWLHGHRLVVITYDPLTTGLVGVGLRWLAGARFICECNGAYDNVHNLADREDPSGAERRTRLVIRVGSWVLSRANHIKLLFPTQIDRFDVPPEIPRTTFQDLVDWSKFSYVAARPEPILLFVGYPFLLKGVDILLEAFARVRPDFPDWRLVLVGHQIPEQATGRKLPLEGVTLLPPQPQDTIARWMEQCSALVLPSRTEAMGCVLIEAALKGRARIASRVGGIPYYVAHDIDGLLFESESVEDLTDTLRRFMENDALQARLGAAARLRAERDFSADVYVRHYSGIIDSL